MDTLRDNAALSWANAMRVGRNRRKSTRCHEIAVGAPITRQDKVIGLPFGIVHQLDQAQRGYLAQLDEVLNFERLRKHRCFGVSVTVRREHLQQTWLEREFDRTEMTGMLCLGIDPDRAALFLALALGKIDHLLQRGNLEDAVPALVPKR